eukprot:TRINITY_DN64784_c0_g1_i4.p1 TRINITY_DN64784_c0_g1~~TRINITY_DN64784_c0_g1_i4.p1  ORF type:complete len:484 (+),score=59.89 TRINITY_DN64784_c0_g1_i4:312-1763(+)
MLLGNNAHGKPQSHKSSPFISNAPVATTAACSQALQPALGGATGAKERHSLASWTRLIGGHAGTSQWRSVAEVLAKIAGAELRTNTITMNAVLNVYAKAAKWEVSTSLVEQLPTANTDVDVISCNTLMGALDRKGRWIDLLHVLASMNNATVQPSERTYTIAIRSSSAKGDPALSWRLLSECGASNVEVDIVAYNTAVSTCQASSAWETMLQVVAGALQAGLQCDTVTQNAGLGVLGDAGRWQAAGAVFEWCKSLGVRPNLIGRRSLSLTFAGKATWWQACCHALAHAEQGEQSVEEMLEVAATTSLRKSAWVAAGELLASAQEAQIEPSLQRYLGNAQALSWHHTLELYEFGRLAGVDDDGLSNLTAQQVVDASSRWQQILCTTQMARYRGALSAESWSSILRRTFRAAARWEELLMLRRHNWLLNTTTDDVVSVCHDMPALDAGAPWWASLRYLCEAVKDKVRVDVVWCCASWSSEMREFC